MIIQMNKISPNLADAEKPVSSASAADVRDDKNISDYIWNYTRDCAVQKDTGKSSIYTEQQAKQLDMEKTELPLAGEISPSSFIAGCMTGEDVKTLDKEQTPLEEYTSSQMEKAVVRVREQRTKTKESVEVQVEKTRDREEHLEKHLEEKVPETDENVTRFIHAAELTAGLNDFSQEAMKYFFSQEYGAVTPQNIGASVVASSYITAPSMASPEQPAGDVASESTFSDMQPQVEDILIKGGVDVSKESLAAAEYLYENNLPVTAEQVKVYMALEQLKDVSSDVLLSRIADAMAEGISPENADLTIVSKEEASVAADALLETDDTSLRQVYKTEADFIRAKRRLEEIRLHMTADAARKMLAKGIELDVSNLEEIVQELRVQEQEASERILEETGLDLQPENAKMAADTLQAAKQVLAAPAEFLGTMKSGAAGQTLQEISDAAFEAILAKESVSDNVGNVEKSRLERAYETVGTQVRTDLGDRMSKAFQNVDAILEDYGLECTEANRRAVRILAYNRMPLTEDSIIDMKAYDKKVTDVMNDLTPSVVAEIVKRRINPLDKTVDELSSLAGEIQAENGNYEDESFARYLWKMDRMGALSEEERQSMIGIYRLLDKVEKSDGAVIGQIVKEGKPLTMSSLLSASRSRRAFGMSVAVDDDFGGLEEVVSKGTSISEQILSAYGESIVRDLKKTLSPKALHENYRTASASEGDADMLFGDVSLETLLEQCEEKEHDNPDMADFYEQMAAQIRAAADDADGKVEKFLDLLEMPDTISYMASAKQLLNGARSTPGKTKVSAEAGSVYSREISEMLWENSDTEAVLDAFDNPDDLDAVYEEIDAEHREKIEQGKQAEDISHAKLESLVQMAGSISFYRNLRTHQMYEIPLVTEHGITNCHVTVKDGDEKQKGTVEITMDSETNGRIQATFRVAGNRVSAFVTADERDGQKFSKAVLEATEKDLEEMGYVTDGMNPVAGKRQSLLTGTRSEGAKNKDLYRIAKVFITRAGEKM